MIKFKDGTPLGIAIGIGTAVLASAVLPALPALVRAARPTARAAVKSGLLLAEKGREFLSEAGEELEDILAEARAELHAEKTGGAAPASDTVGAPSPSDDL
jgi:hypothetical protein